jgi:hypothetical protein
MVMKMMKKTKRMKDNCTQELDCFAKYITNPTIIFYIRYSPVEQILESINDGDNSRKSQCD